MSTPEVTVIDYGVGNLLSVQRGLEHCGAKVILTTDPEKILAAKRVVLPGVGAFSNAMQSLDRLGLVAAIRELAMLRTPLLCICLGTPPESFSWQMRDKKKKFKRFSNLTPLSFYKKHIDFVLITRQGSNMERVRVCSCDPGQRSAKVERERSEV